jgi:hypothetical protein
MDAMTFGKRAVPPKLPEPDDGSCPHCRGVGAVRGRGQRKVCVPCSGTGLKPKPAVIDAPPTAVEATAAEATAGEAAAAVET